MYKIHDDDDDGDDAGDDDGDDDDDDNDDDNDDDDDDGDDGPQSMQGTPPLIHISEPTRLLSTSYAVFCLNKKPPVPPPPI